MTNTSYFKDLIEEELREISFDMRAHEYEMLAETVLALMEEAYRMGTEDGEG